MTLVIFFFFFSSRRRHTRLQGDWSSDVCSSDLARPMSLVRSADLHAVPHHRGGRRGPVDRRHAGLRTDGPLRRGRRAGHHPPRHRHQDRKSTRLNSSHLVISYAVFCLKKKKKKKINTMKYIDKHE